MSHHGTNSSSGSLLDLVSGSTHQGSGSTGSHEAHEVSHAEHANHDAANVVFTSMVCVLIGCFFAHHKHALRLPYTVLVMGLGLAIGGISIASDSATDFMEHFLVIRHIDPHLLFHIFLPVLVFDATREMKLATFTRVLWQALLLAGPGLLMNTFLVATVMKYAFFNDWNWPAAIVFGAVLSATDPVAVVAVLKDLDADVPVTTLTDAEALLNDGTAIILFTMFLPGSHVNGELPPWYEFIWRGLLFTIGAFIIGKIIGFIVVSLLKTLKNEPIVETLIEFTSAYVAFYVGEVIARSSGVLVLATMGLHVASHRGTLIKLHNAELNKGFWEVMVFYANTVLFFIVGVIIAVDGLTVATGRDFGILIALYLMLQVFRAVMLLILTPLLNLFRFKINFRRFSMLVHGALRGGISLTLALVITQDTRVIDSFRSKVLFFVGGIVLLSVCVNGSTATILVQKLGLKLRPAHATYAQQHGDVTVAIYLHNEVRALSKADPSSDANWLHLSDTVVRLVHPKEKKLKELKKMFIGPGSPVGGDDDFPRRRQNGAAGSPMFGDDANPFSPTLPQFIPSPVVPPQQGGTAVVEEGSPLGLAHEDDVQMTFTAMDQETQQEEARLAEARRRSETELDVMAAALINAANDDDIFIPTILRAMKRAVWHLRDEGHIYPATLYSMLELLETHIDSNSVPTLAEFREHLDNMSLPIEDRITDALPCCRYSGDIVTVSKHHEPTHVPGQDDPLAVPVRSVETFQRKNVIRYELLETFVELCSAARKVLYTLVSGERQDAVRSFFMYIDEVEAGATRMLKDVQEQHPGLHAARQTKQAKLHLLHHSVELLEKLEKDRLLSRSQAEKKIEEITTLIDENARAPLHNFLPASDEQVFIESRFMECFGTEAQVEIIREYCELKTCKEGETFELLPNSFGVVVHGCLTTAHSDYVAGEFFALHSVLGQFDFPAVHAVTETRFYEVDGVGFMVFFRRTSEKTQKELWKLVGRQLASIAFHRCYPTSKLDDSELNMLYQGGSVVLVQEEGQEVGVTKDDTMFLLAGGDVTDTWITGAERTMPHNLKARWHKDSVLFIVRNISLSEKEIRPTGVPFVDAANCRFEKVLATFKRAYKDECHDWDELLRGLGVYSKLITALGQTLSDMGIHPTKFMDQMLEFTAFGKKVEEWLYKRFALQEEIDTEEAIDIMDEWFDKFAAPAEPHPWAVDLMENHRDDVKGLWRIEDAIPESSLHGQGSITIG